MKFIESAWFPLLAAIAVFVLIFTASILAVHCSEKASEDACVVICDTRHSRMKDFSSMGCLCENGDLIPRRTSD